MNRLNPQHVGVGEAAAGERGSIGATAALAGLGLKVALGAVGFVLVVLQIREFHIGTAFQWKPF